MVRAWFLNGGFSPPKKCHFLEIFLLKISGLGFFDGWRRRSRGQDLDEGRGWCRAGLLFHGDVHGGGWGVHGVAGADDRGPGIVPCVVPGDADQDGDSEEQDDDREGGALRAVVSAGKPELAEGAGLDDRGKVGNAADGEAEEDGDRGVPGEVEPPAKPEAVGTEPG